MSTDEAVDSIPVPEEVSFDDIVRLVRGIGSRDIGRYAFARKDLRVQLRGFRPDHPEKFPKSTITKVARFVQDNPSEKTDLMKVWRAHNSGLRDRVKESVQPQSIEDDLVRVLSDLDLRDDTLPDRVYWVLRLDERQELHLALSEGLLGQVADGNSLLWLKARNAHLLKETTRLQSEIDKLRKGSAESAKRGEREHRRSQAEKAALEKKILDLRKALNEEKDCSRESAAKAAEVPRLREQLEKSRRQAAQTEDQLRSALESYEQERKLNEQIKADLETEKQAHERDYQALLEAISENARLKDEITSSSSQSSTPVNARPETPSQLTDVVSAWSRAVTQAAVAIDSEKTNTDQQQLDPASEWARWQTIESGFVHEFLYPDNGLSLTSTAERAQRLLAFRWCLLEYLKISAMTGKGVI